VGLVINFGVKSMEMHQSLGIQLM